MSTINRTLLAGNLGADPVLRYFPGGKALCTFRMATSEVVLDHVSGEKDQKTEWHNIYFCGRLGERIAPAVKKGDLVYVEGRIRHRKIKKEGKDCWITEIEGDLYRMLRKKFQPGAEVETEPLDLESTEDTPPAAPSIEE